VYTKSSKGQRGKKQMAKVKVTITTETLSFICDETEVWVNKNNPTGTLIPAFAKDLCYPYHQMRIFIEPCEGEE